MNDHHEHGGHEHDHGWSARALTLISLAHGINHAQSALKPLVYPLVLLQLGFGYAELGIMLGVASAVGGSLQLVAGGLGRFVKRHLLLGLGNAFVGICFVLIAVAQSFPQFFLWTVMSRVGGAAQHPVGSALLSHHFQRKHLGTALAAHFTAGNVGTALIPLFAAILISLWGWRMTTILFALPAIIVGVVMCIFLKDPRAKNEPESRPNRHFGKTASWPSAIRTYAGFSWPRWSPPAVPATASSQLFFLSILLTISAWDRPQWV